MANISLTVAEPQADDLTWREQEVLNLLAGRLSNKEIGANLHLAESTVKWYNQQIFSKLGVVNRKQAAKRARDLKLLESQDRLPAEKRPQFQHNLPAQLSSFVGRKKEVAEVRQLLKSSRLVALTGAGGSGKTRLALHVARELINAYKDGIWLVELAPLTDPKLVPSEIAKVLKVSHRGETPFVDLLKRYLSSKELLLVLDNFEHLTAAAPMLAKLLAAAPDLSVLVTSRANLDIYGEQEYSLSPLNLPNLNLQETAKSLLDYEAVDLFSQRAKAAQPRLILDKEDIQAIARICVRLDGLPLAIELAAPLARIFGLSSLAKRLEKDLETLPKGPRNLPERQQTLRATMDWSYQLLDEDNQILFDRLSIFNGGGTFDAIEAVCAAGLSGKVVDRLASLVENNLVIPVETADGELHFSMLETIKEYSKELLATRPDADDVHRKHAAYYADLAEKADRQVRGELNKYWFKRLRAENQNMRAVLAWSLEGDEHEYGLRIVGSLLYHWYYNGLGPENSHFMNLAMELSQAASPKLRAPVLLTAGFLAYGRSDLEKSRTYLEEAQQIYMELGDDLGQAHALMHLSVTSLDETENLDKDLELALQALDIFFKIEDEPGIAQAKNVLGEITRVQGNYKAAKKYYQESLSLSQETGEDLRQAIQYINLAFIAYHEGDFAEANQLNKQGLALFAELDSYYGMATHIASFAGPIVALGFPKRAARLLGAASAHQETVGTYQQPADQPEIELFLNATQKALGEEAFQAAWDEGQRMPIQEAVAYALSNEDAEE